MKFVTVGVDRRRDVSYKCGVAGLADHDDVLGRSATTGTTYRCKDITCGLTAQEAAPRLTSNPCEGHRPSDRSHAERRRAGSAPLPLGRKHPGCLAAARETP